MLHYSLSDELQGKDASYPHIPETTSIVYLFVSLDGRFVDPENGRDFGEVVAERAIPAAYARKPSPALPRPSKARRSQRKGKKKRSAASPGPLPISRVNEFCGPLFTDVVAAGSLRKYDSAATADLDVLELWGFAARRSGVLSSR